jgi:hypothetical protein
MLTRVKTLIEQKEKIDAELEALFGGTHPKPEGDRPKRKWTRRTPVDLERLAAQIETPLQA